VQSLRIRIDRIVDFGTVVSLVGVDVQAAMPVTIHVDHRPFAAFWEAWCKAGRPQPIEYAADRLLLHLDMPPAEDGEGAQLIELDTSTAESSNNDGQSVQELDR
jgi:hypothetical protein